MRSELPGTVPEIPVQNIHAALGSIGQHWAALDYYQSKLDFTLDWSDEELEPSGISQDNCRLFPAKRIGRVMTMLALL